MAGHVDHIAQDYTIPRGQTATYYFWWPGGGDNKHYFDVSIAPHQGVDIFGGVVDKEVPLHLRETRREMERVYDRDTNEIRYILYLTITNEEPNLDVTFTANHVQIY